MVSWPFNGRDAQQGIDTATVTFGGGATTPYECEGYRLPTEAEWEFAARSGGTVPDAFPNGGSLYSGDWNNCGGNLQLDNGTLLDDQAWYCGNNNGQSEPVHSLAANPSGLYDMSGNVYEWNYDWYQSYGGTVTVGADNIQVWVTGGAVTANTGGGISVRDNNITMDCTNVDFGTGLTNNTPWDVTTGANNYTGYGANSSFSCVSQGTCN